MLLYYHKVDNSVLILTATGELNADTSKALMDQLQTFLDFGVKKLIIDCTSLAHISSYGIGVLMRLNTHIAKLGGQVKVAAAPSRVIQALNLVRLGSFFQFYPDVESARAAFDEEAKKA
jgi:anti-anti-sigma factor